MGFWSLAAVTAWLRACETRAQGLCLCSELVRVPPKSALRRYFVVVLLGQLFRGEASGGQRLPVARTPHVGHLPGRLWGGRDSLLIRLCWSSP